MALSFIHSMILPTFTELCAACVLSAGDGAANKTQAWDKSLVLREHSLVGVTDMHTGNQD